MNGKPQDEDEKPEKKKVDPVDFNVDEVNGLAEVIVNLSNLPEYKAISQAAAINLAIIAVEVQEELDKRAQEAKEEAEKEEAEKEKKRQDRLKEVEDEKVLAEKKEREEREKAAKEREAARQKEPAHA